MCLINGDELPLWVFNAVLPPEVCEVLSRSAAAIPHAPGEVGHGEAGVRFSEVAFLPPDHWIAGVLDRCAWEANERAGWSYQLQSSEPVQHASYAPGGGYGWHVDTAPLDGAVRKLTVLVQLSPSEAYDGGDLEIRRHGVPGDERYPIPPAARRQGSLIVFPSFLLHRVSPVVRGRRESLTTWVRGPRFT